MSIDEITLNWFRGASHQNNLELKSKSSVIFGPNGSGKSSFVDALEYTISNGSIRHLSNEYSGKKLEKAIVNVLKNADQNCHLSIRCGVDTARVTILPSGTAHFDLPARFRSWKRNSIILRQDEVSAFVLSDKSEKYSSLLPLIGLEELETAIENIKLISKKFKEKSCIDSDIASAARLRQKLGNSFESTDENSAKSQLKRIFNKYFPGAPLPSLNKAAAEIRLITNPIYNQLDSVRKAFLLLETAKRLELNNLLADAVSSLDIAAKSAEPLIEKRINLLNNARFFHDEKNTVLDCPACGQSISSQEYIDHIQLEMQRLEVAQKSYSQKDVCCNSLNEALFHFNSIMANTDVVNEFVSKAEQDIKDYIAAIRAFDRNSFKSQTQDLDLRVLILSIPLVQTWLENKTSHAPLTTNELVSEIKVLDLADQYIELISIEKKISRYSPAIEFFAKVQYFLRRRLNEFSSQIIKNISADMQSMWAQLHPDEPIDDVSLDLQDGKDKAVDICLRFHGKSQNSPRLTLSEGHRNSLGLVVFLAFAKKTTNENIPLILDDIVTSFDREHRSSVSELLEKDFCNRQVIIFTHDDQWYTELRNRMPKWNFVTLLPYKDPAIGIRGSIKLEAFSIARDLVELDASAAANKARGILDVNMSFVAEKLEIPVPFIRGTKNDLRNCLDLVSRFQKRASEKMHRKSDGQTHQKCTVAVQAAVSVSQLLIPFGNAGSHGRYVSSIEADKLILACENFMKSLQCDDCETSVWYSRVQSKHQNCQCDALRWKD